MFCAGYPIKATGNTANSVSLDLAFDFNSTCPSLGAFVINCSSHNENPTDLSLTVEYYNITTKSTNTIPIASFADGMQLSKYCLDVWKS